MSARILDGKALAQELRAEAAAQIAELRTQIDRPPTIAVVQVGDDPAATRYVRSIDRLCQSLGAACRAIALPAETAQADLEATVAMLSADDRIDGILLQLPLPAGLTLDGVLSRLAPEKDLDGIHPINAGLLAQGRPTLTPNTPAGGIELLRRYGIEIRGRRAAVVGRSAIVGRPMALLLLQADATVTICHSRTPDLGAVLRECDIIAAAAGRPGLITADMVKPGATVIDFGTNVLADGSMVGDVDFAAVAEVAGAITPVPGGTGPVTNVMLMRNLITATRTRLGI
ncbi:bifunctional 5,10-methylenetetrahydrofolate dehydrogenase/5,10-methenyltetrahydrofolate cyclohydrolase [Chloroflexus sp.]|uniref:bifunctional 5,10-methylenetetrahydrofolate dehydrogenase/5,10-methenyltetrahydrofolate cyclohydrolase n=1 Tax=Chloroflexus sp. TaxID=1904827 RepID=UPI0021DBCDA5|nr:bifunctional 5,10-methylenetetrahydrofolate dehydrogenase/5,10-methenyltetrahydrofolate cyclohydrolase [Chloroflexus sp.]GIV94683.1 MAG: bifunctional protein FolD [Chloroflexus sp.]